jgi:hypothetical protein
MKIRKFRTANQEFRVILNDLGESEGEENDTESGNNFRSNPFNDFNERVNKMNEDYEKKINAFGDRFSFR